MPIITRRTRNVASEACPVCSVPATIGCRAMKPPHSSFPAGVVHDIPVVVGSVDDQHQALDDTDLYMVREQMRSLIPSSSPVIITTNTNPTIIVEQQLPQVNGTVVKVTMSVAAAFVNFTQAKFWERRAILIRQAGTWSVLILEADNPLATGGAGAWACAPSLPGGDVVRATGTGVAGPPNTGWVGKFKIEPF